MTFSNCEGNYYYCALPSCEIPEDKVLFYAYIYDLISHLDISKDCIEQATKKKTKNKNNMHVNFASTHTMNFVVADADLVYKVHKVYPAIHQLRAHQLD